MSYRQQFIAKLPFKPDPFQVEAFDIIDRDESLLVTVPTGSGKTLVAAYAMGRALEQGLRTFYTSPLKALSNQKFQELQEMFPEQVGLLTGDISYHRDAPILVMTTEVYRNFLYGNTNPDSVRFLKNLGVVVFDECHYMNDVDRGTVWEESLVYSPLSAQLVALSATVANEEELAAWVSSIHRPMRLVQHVERPVPLQYYYFNTDKKLLSIDVSGAEAQLEGHDKKRKGFKRRQLKKREHTSEKAAEVALIDVLRGKNLLPAIYFCFSRRRCDELLQELYETARQEQKVVPELEQAIAKTLEEYPNLREHHQLQALRFGIASHHAGQLPLWKSIVEQYFQAGHVQVVFATETLAAGINMPARTVVLSQLSKYDGISTRLLKGSEFLQMAGRAGRRGLDETGAVVLQSHVKEPEYFALKLVKSKPERLESNFRPSYSMVLNLLQYRSLSECKTLMEQSFGQFLVDHWDENKVERLQELTDKINFLKRPLCPDKIGDLKKFSDARNRLRKVKSAMRSQNRLSRRDFAKLREQQSVLKRKVYDSPCHRCAFAAPCRSQHEELRAVQKERKALKKEHRDYQNKSPFWNDFLAVMHTLESVGYIQDGKPNDMGSFAGSLRTTNPVLVTEVIAQEFSPKLEPEHWIAILASVLEEDYRRLEMNIDALPKPILKTLHGVEETVDFVHNRQADWQVNCLVPFSPQFSLWVYRWAKGDAFEDILEDSGFEGGDFVRLIRRTLDMAQQLSHWAYSDHPWSEACLQAARMVPMLDRDIVRAGWLEFEEQLLESDSDET